MIFRVSHRTIYHGIRSEVHLIPNNWNDFGFRTLFALLYIDENSVRHEIGSVKIGFSGQHHSMESLPSGAAFESLGEGYFSLGQSDSYYEALNQLGEALRDEILTALRDIAKFTDLFELVKSENVMKTSLMRSVSQISITGQYHRIASGDTRLTDYSFVFHTPRLKGSSNNMSLSFNVEPDTFPPTNIHVLIGSNGVGKTHLINNMISSLRNTNKTKFGTFKSDILEDEAHLFANLTSITFSAFDEIKPQMTRSDQSRGIRFSYIGLRRTSGSNSSGPKSTTMLKNEFFKSLQACKNNSQNKRWEKSIQRLESDPNFQDASIKELIEIDNDAELKKNAFEIFGKLSSGHKIVLLTITRLIETLQERSLVLIDEPEAHLHPPLLSAFTRTLSELLIETNSVAIIATHSPVVLQEVPKSCIWKLRRTGLERVAERLTIESFGENVGTLTNEIFSLEVTNSGYYKLLVQAVNESSTYSEAIRYFDNQLGMEARAIIMSLIANR